MALAQPIPQVEVALVEERRVAPTIELVGSLRPLMRSRIASEVEGLVASIPVEEGDEVTQGGLLCQLRNEKSRFALEEAQARQRQLGAVVSEHEAMAKKAEFEQLRTERLWDAKQSSEKEYKDAQEDYRAAWGRLEQARFAMEAQKAAVDRLADDFTQTSILAPFDGVVVTKHTEVGSWVSAGGLVLEMLSLSTVRARIPAPERILAFCQPGADVQVTVEALGKGFGGKIARVIPDADERARTFPVEIDIPNPDGVLIPGMFARVATPSGPSSESHVVPKDAVVTRGPAQMIFVVKKTDEGDLAQPVPVEIVAELLEFVAVRSAGLKEGDRVVVRGNEYMFGPGKVVATEWKPPEREPLAVDSRQ